MALAVVFAMLASYVLSRTLVPVLVNFLLGAEHNFEGHTVTETKKPSIFRRINERFNDAYTRFQHRYTAALEAFLAHRRQALFASIAVMLSAFLLLPFIGRDFFPSVDAGRSSFTSVLVPAHGLKAPK